MENSKIQDCLLIPIKNASDIRGCLNYIHFDDSIPLKPTRLFYITNVPNNCTRGNHAHVLCEQFLIALSGEILVTLNDGSEETELSISNPNEGIYIPPGIWSSQKFLNSNSCLVVLASMPYDPSEYISDFNTFKQLKNK